MSGDTIYSNPTTPEAIAKALQAENWKEYLAQPGLADVTRNVYPINAFRGDKSWIERCGRGIVMKIIGRM